MRQAPTGGPVAEARSRTPGSRCWPPPPSPRDPCPRALTSRSSTVTLTRSGMHRLLLGMRGVHVRRGEDPRGRRSRRTGSFRGRRGRGTSSGNSGGSSRLYTAKSPMRIASVAEDAGAHRLQQVNVRVRRVARLDLLEQRTPSSACPRDTACTCRTTHACRTSTPAARAAPRQRSSTTMSEAAPKNEPVGLDRVVVERRVELVGELTRTSRWGMTHFSCRPSGTLPRDVVDELAHRRPQLEARSCRAARCFPRWRRSPCRVRLHPDLRGTWPRRARG